jgi:hypothetical protein
MCPNIRCNGVKKFWVETKHPCATVQATTKAQHFQKVGSLESFQLDDGVGLWMRVQPWEPSLFCVVLGSDNAFDSKLRSTRAPAAMHRPSGVRRSNCAAPTPFCLFPCAPVKVFFGSNEQHAAMLHATQLPGPRTCAAWTWPSQPTNAVAVDQ